MRQRASPRNHDRQSRTQLPRLLLPAGAERRLHRAAAGPLRRATRPAVDASWAGSSAASATRATRRDATARAGRAPTGRRAPTDELTAALTGEWPDPRPPRSTTRSARRPPSRASRSPTRRCGRRCSTRLRALMLIRAYRIRGHLDRRPRPAGPARRRSRTPSSTPPPTASPRPTWTGRSSSTTCSASRPRRMRADRGAGAAHLLRHLRAPVHAHLGPRAGRLAQGADRGLRQGDHLHPARAARRS